MNRHQINAKITEKRAAMTRLNDACVVNGEVREMTEDELKQFDDLKKEVETLKAMLARMADAEDEEAEDEPVRSTRVGKPISSAPAVHTKKHKYSLTRALGLASEGKSIDGIEGEVSAEIARRRNKRARGFYLPYGDDDEIREICGFRTLEHRDLTTTTGAGAVFTVPELPFIELLRNKLVLQEMGATFLPIEAGTGKFSIPRQSGAGSAQWITEGSSVTTSNQTLDAVAFVDKTLAAATNVSRKFLYQSSVAAEAFVLNDLAKDIAIAIDAAAINGSGSGATPTGILQNSTIQTNSASLAMGANGGEPTWAKVVALESEVAAYNADRGALRYLTSPQLRGNLKVTPVQGTGQSSTYPVFIWSNDGFTATDVPIGTVNGYKAYATSNVPANLTKGTANNCSALIFGNFEDLMIATWGAVDVLVNPWVNQLAGAIQVSTFVEVDVEIRHPESFAIISDMLIS